jgi:nucleoside-diphosphate-sugar epimerase
MKIVVTGGSGSLGQAVIAELQAHNYEVLSLDRRPHPGSFRPSWTVELTEPSSLFEACCGARGVVHLAAYMAPDITTDCKTFNTNVAMTYNVLKAASIMGVQRVVVGSSTAAYGFIYGPAGNEPRYLPADEDHPCAPADPYGLSKVVGERIADSFASASPMTIVSLRFPGINFDPEFRLLVERTKNPGARRSGFWAYVDVRDAAIACRLALEAQLSGHKTFNVAAPTSSMREPTHELIRHYLPGVTDLRREPNGRWSGIDSSRAESALGFRARHLWEDFVRG